MDVLRLWAFSHEQWHGFETDEGVYSEPQFMLFDYIVKSAAEHDLKLIPVFENYWTAYGGIDARLKREGLPSGNHSSRAAFFTDEGCRKQYKDYVKFFVNRINHYNGIAYKNDPTIFAWELMNEPRYQDVGDNYESRHLRAWVDEMGAYIKSIDPNHMISTGIEGHGLKYGFGGDEGNNFIIVHQSEYIDFSSAHPYTTEHWAGPGHRPMTWEETAKLFEAWIKDSHVIGKPLFIGEWNYHTDVVDRVDWWDKTFALIEASDIIGGSAFWWYSDRAVDPIFGILEGAPELKVYKDHSEAMIAKRGSAPIGRPPVAHFTTKLMGHTLSVEFDASLSKDPDGTITRYDWSFGTDGVTVTHTFPKEGTYPVTLTVTDNDGLKASQTKSITLNLSAPYAPTSLKVTSVVSGAGKTVPKKNNAIPDIGSTYGVTAREKALEGYRQPGFPVNCNDKMIISFKN